MIRRGIRHAAGQSSFDGGSISCPRSDDSRFVPDRMTPFAASLIPFPHRAGPRRSDVDVKATTMTGAL